MTAAAYTLEKSLVKVDGVNMSYGDAVILRDVNLEIRDVVRPGVVTGQIVALLGPSGMGKSTLFRILAGILTPVSGQVLIGPEAKPVEPGMVGVVFQNYQLFEHRTVLGNLAVAARRVGMSRSEAKKAAHGMLARFGLEDFWRRYPMQLSGGQRQRVAIAQQFVCSQHFLLMDEPFSGLDPLAIERVSKLISEVANLDEMNTLIVVTHNIEAAIEVADTIFVLGRDRDAAGNPIPGARVQESYNLIERNLAWREGIGATPEFVAMAREIRERFRTL